MVFGSGGDPETDIPNLTLVPLQPDGVASLKDRKRVLPALYKAAVEWKPDVITCHEPLLCPERMPDMRQTARASNYAQILVRNPKYDDIPSEPAFKNPRLPYLHCAHIG